MQQTIHNANRHNAYSEAGYTSVKLSLAAYVMLALAILLAAMLALPAHSQVLGRIGDEKEHSYAVHETIELGGHYVDRAGSAAMWSTLVNTQSGPRIMAFNMNAHSVNTKKTPLFDDLSLNGFGFGGDPYATSTLRAYKGRAYKLDASFRRNRQYFDYNLFGNPLNPNSSVPFVPVVSSPHLFNTVRKTGDLNLTLFPLSRVSARMGFWRTINEGPSFSSNVSKSNTNPLLNQAWRYTNDVYTGGVDWKAFPKTIISFDELVTNFKQDTRWDLAPENVDFQLANGTPVSLGLTVGANTKGCLVSGTTDTVKPSCNGTLAYHRYEPVRTLIPTEQLRFNSAAIPRVTLNGRLLYSSGAEKLNHYDEYYSGWSDSSINTTGRNIIRYSGTGTQSHLGRLPRIDVSGDFGMTAQLARKWQFSELFDFRSFRDNGVTTPVQATQFGTSLANTSNFYSPSLCPPPYTASTCPLHTTKTAADLTQAYRQEYFAQTSRMNTSVLSYSPVAKLQLSIGYRYRERYIIKTLQTTTTSTFTPPFANRGACANVPLNPDGTCTITPASTPAIERNEINEHWGLVGIATQPTPEWKIKLNLEAMSADEAFTQISPRNAQHYILRTLYKPHNSWMSFSGAVNILESRDNVTYVHHLAHARDFSFGAALEPSDKWSLDLDYAYDNDYSRTDICYYATSPLAGAGSCAIPGSVANIQPFQGNGTYDAPAHFGSISAMWAPNKLLRFDGGFQASASNGTGEVLNDRQVMGSLQSSFNMPFGAVSLNMAHGWSWKAALNYYGYGEGSAVGPTLPRDAHGTVVTGSVKHTF